LAFFSKTNVMIQILHKLAVHSLSRKRRYFCRFFGEYIFKIITSVQFLISPL
jgi:hypothetical protein